MKAALASGVEMLSDPGNAWAQEIFDLYMDCKDFMRPGPGDLSPSLRRAFRIIRQASAGRLGAAQLF